MTTNLLGILGGFILLMLGVIIGVRADTVVGVLVMFGGLVSMFHFLPYYKGNDHE
jgi:hypothetical protein